MDSKKIVFHVVSISLSILIALLVVFGLYKLGGYAYSFGYRVFTEEAMEKEPGRDKPVTITENMSNQDIAELLESDGLIEDAKLFLVQLKLSAYSDDLKPGNYTLNTSMTPKEMIVVMATTEESTEEGTEEQ